MGFHRATSIVTGTRVVNSVGICTTKASNPSRYLRMLSKFMTTEASQGGVIALRTTIITQQHDIVNLFQGTACRQILWGDSLWT